MPRKKKQIPEYKQVVHNGYEYYRTRVRDADGNRVAIYGATRKELHKKVQEAQRQIDDIRFSMDNPTVRDYCEKWLTMKSATVQPQTLRGYRSLLNKYVVEKIGEMYMDEVTLDDVRMLMIPLAKRSSDIYSSLNMLIKGVFKSAEINGIIKKNPATALPPRGGRPPRKKAALSDEQAERLLKAVKGLPPYVFVMIGLYAGLRREEILALEWDCVFLDVRTPYISVRRAWRSENNHTSISTVLKTPAAKRDIPIPKCLSDCLREVKEASISDFVIANSNGEPLKYSQFQRLWRYITVRTVKGRKNYSYINGQKVVKTIHPTLGGHPDNNPNLIYSLDFEVTPHQLRHTYITNLIAYGVDPKTVQYLAGHENSKMTMDIYAKVKYNNPKDIIGFVNKAFS